MDGCQGVKPVWRGTGYGSLPVAGPPVMQDLLAEATEDADATFASTQTRQARRAARSRRVSAENPTIRGQDGSRATGQHASQPGPRARPPEQRAQPWSPGTSCSSRRTS